LFADEPTGNLDDENAAEIRMLLTELNETYETTLVVVTHDPRVAELTARTIQLQGGMMVSDTALEAVS
jgi:putative ABC transport system ATP-binding protein